MRLTRLELSNYGSFRNFAIDFAPGLTGVVGSNGSGKSTLVNAIRFALTGENWAHGNKDANICQLAPPEERAFVKLGLEHQSGQIDVSRYLRPETTKSAAEIPGQKPIRGDKAVQLKLTELLGLSKEVLNDYALVDQGQMFAFLAKQPKDRSQAFQQLFQLTKAERVWQAIGQHLLKLPAPPSSAALDQIRQQLTARAAQITALGQRLQTEFAALQQSQEGMDREQQLLAAFEQKLAAQRQASNLETQLLQLQPRLMTLTPELQASEENLQVLEQAIQRNQPASDEAQAALANLDQWERLNKLRQQIEQTADQLVTERQQLGAEPVYPAGIPGVPQLVEQLAAHQARLAACDQFLRTFDNGVAECPTCGTPTTALTNKLFEYQQQREQAAKAIEQLISQRDTISQYQQELLGWRSRNADLVRREGQLAVQRAALVDLQQPSCADRAELTRRVTEVRGWQAALQQHRPNVERGRREHTQLQTRIQAAQEQLAAYQVMVATNNVTEQEYQFVKQQQQHRQQLRGVQLQLESELNVLSTEQRNQQTMLQNLEQQLAAGQAIEEHRQHLEQVRSILHYTAAPRLVIHRKLQELEQMINDETLQQFQAPFTVKAEEGLSFTARFADGRNLPAERLSGGQKVVLAWAFRLAVNLLFAAGLGFLVLDEPTVFLDEFTIQRFGEVLSRLRHYSASRGLQIIIVTHEASLANHFDQVVRLPGVG